MSQRDDDQRDSGANSYSGKNTQKQSSLKTPGASITGNRLEAVLGPFTPAQILMITIGGVFLADLIAMLVLNELRPLPYLLDTLFDALIITGLVFPVIYFLSYKPLLKNFAIQRQTELSALSGVSQVISKQLTLSETLHAIFNACRQLVGANAGCFTVLQEDQDHAFSIVTSDFNGSLDPSILVPVRELREKAYYSAKTIYKNNLSLGYWANRSQKGQFLENALFAPIPFEEKVVGIIGLANKPGGFTEYDARIATVFGEMTDIALMHAKIEQSLREAHEKLELRVRERTQELERANTQLANTNMELQAEITERKRFEAQLRLLTTTLEAAANGVIITDRQGNILWANPAFTVMSGFPVEEILGRNPRFLKTDRQAPAFFQNLWQTILSGEVWRGEITNRRKDGSFYLEEQTITPVYNENGEIAHFIAIKQDITDRKRIQAELEKNYQELCALSKAEHNARQFAEALREESQALSRTLDLGTVMNTLLEFIELFIPYDSAKVSLLEDEWLKVRAVRGYDKYTNPDRVRNCKIQVRENNHLHFFLTNHNGLLIEDTREFPNWEPIEGLEYIRNWIGVPLVAGGRVIGLCCLEKSEPGFFTREHVEMAEVLVAQAGVAVQNASLFEQVRLGHERLQSLSRRLVEIQERERRYIAMELHDDTSQALMSLIFELHLLEENAADPNCVRDGLIKLKSITEGVLTDLHRLAMDLRPASLDYIGLVPSLRQLVQTLREQSGMNIQFKDIGIGLERQSSELEINLYRIVQEALNNVIRHAQATQVDIILEARKACLRIIIEDNGVGFDKQIIGQNGRLGLVGMQERVEMFGGTLRIDSVPGSGTTIVVEAPYGD